MNKASLVAGLMAVLFPTLAPADLPGRTAMVTQLIVQPKGFDVAHARRLTAQAMAPFNNAAQVGMEHVRPLAGQAQVMRLPHAMSTDEARIYAKRLVDAGVALAAEPDVRVFPSRVPLDPMYAQQWHYHGLLTGRPYGQNNYGLNLPAAWDISTGSDSVVVAVVDTGLLPHEDIDPGRVRPGYDFISDAFYANDGNGRDANPMDPGDWVSADDLKLHPECELSKSSWHGTHVAGSMGASTNNHLGGAGVDWQTHLLPVRVLGKCGGTLSDIVDGMYWAAGLPVPDVANNPHPADVLNLSLSAHGVCPVSIQTAIDAVNSTGAQIIVAAGNGPADANAYFPGNCSGVIMVAATDRQGQRTSYTNIGTVVTISAPGGETSVDSGVLSTFNSGVTTPVPGGDIYVHAYGTSMATAQVSGVVALMRAVNPTLTTNRVRDALRATATPFPQYGNGLDCSTLTCGAGIVRADWAVLAAQGVDFVPNAFGFTTQTGVAPNAVLTSEAVTIGGLGHQTAISVRGGEYSLGCTNSFTGAPGEISNGQSVCLRHTSAAGYSASVTTTLTIGGVSGSFTSTTAAAPASGGGGGGALGVLGVGALFGLAGWRRRQRGSSH